MSTKKPKNEFFVTFSQVVNNPNEQCILLISKPKNNYIGWANLTRNTNYSEQQLIAILKDVIDFLQTPKLPSTN